MSRLRGRSLRELSQHLLSWETIRYCLPSNRQWGDAAEEGEGWISNKGRIILFWTQTSSYFTFTVSGISGTCRWRNYLCRNLLRPSPPPTRLIWSFLGPWCPRPTLLIIDFLKLLLRTALSAASSWFMGSRPALHLLLPSSLCPRSWNLRSPSWPQLLLSGWPAGLPAPCSRPHQAAIPELGKAHLLAIGF